MAVADGADDEVRKFGGGKLGLDLGGLEGGKEGVVVVALEEGRLVGGVGVAQAAGVRDGGGTAEIHHEDEGAGSGELFHRSPKGLRIVQLMEEAVADDGVVAGARHGGIGEHAVDEADAFASIAGMLEEGFAGLDHCGGAVDAVDFALGEGRGETDGNIAGAAAEIHDVAGYGAAGEGDAEELNEV